MNGGREKELEYLRQRMAILDRVIAGFEQLANLVPPKLRLYRCDDRGLANGRLRGTRGAASLGKNFGR